jgi:hypothetical protein
LHTVAAAMRDDPKAVVLDFVNPAWPGRRLLCWPREAGLISGKDCSARTRRRNSLATDIAGKDRGAVSQRRAGQSL